MFINWKEACSKTRAHLERRAAYASTGAPSGFCGVSTNRALPRHFHCTLHAVYMSLLLLLLLLSTVEHALWELYGDIDSLCTNMHPFSMGSSVPAKCSHAIRVISLFWNTTRQTHILCFDDARFHSIDPVPYCKHLGATLWFRTALFMRET